MSQWKNPWDFPVPALAPGVEEADQMLAENIHAAMVNAGSNFLAAKPDEQYSSPQAFTENILSYAVYLKHGYTQRQYASPDWDPIKAGFKAAYAGLDFLKSLAVNAGDPNTVSIYDAWVAGTGQAFGGHLPEPTGDGFNTSTGPSAGPGGILGGGK
jgi:hypothetical protein